MDKYKLPLLFALLVFLFVILTGCVKKQYVKQPQTQLQKDKAECEFESRKVSGYDSVDRAINQGNARRACMAAKGYIKK